MIPQTVQHLYESEHFFDVAVEVFRCLDEEYQEDLPLAAYLQDWSALLLSYQHDEVFGNLPLHTELR